jgi:glucose-1-phosphate thymidylyltransferase
VRAIIPVAGLGSRLKPHTYSTPKVLINVGGRPILGHILEKLIEEEVYNATFVIGHLGDMIIDYVRLKYPSIKAEFVEQNEMEGLGHAIYTAIPTIDEEEIFIILGDTIFDVNLKDVFRKKETSLGVKEVEDPRRFGVAVVQDGFITQLIEKPLVPVSNFALVGLYYIANSEKLIKSLNSLIEKDIRTNGEFQLTDALQMMIAGGEKIKAFPVEGWYDCGKPDTLLATNKYLLDKKSVSKKFDSVIINHPVFIPEDADIKNSVIGPYTTVDSGCKIDDCIIKNTIIGSNVQVSKTLLENSIIGSNVIIRGMIKRLNSGDSSEIDFF